MSCIPKWPLAEKEVPTPDLVALTVLRILHLLQLDLYLTFSPDGKYFEGRIYSFVPSSVVHVVDFQQILPQCVSNCAGDGSSFIILSTSSHSGLTNHRLYPKSGLPARTQRSVFFADYKGIFIKSSFNYILQSPAVLNQGR